MNIFSSYLVFVQNLTSIVVYSAQHYILSPLSPDSLRLAVRGRHVQDCPSSAVPHGRGRALSEVHHGQRLGQAVTGHV